MSGPLGSQQWMYSTGFYPYEIDQSLRFDFAYLNRTPSVASNRKTWTWSGWVKRSILNTGHLLDVRTGGDIFVFDIGDDNKIISVQFNNYNSQFGLQTTAVFRDPSAWYHIVFVFDTTQAIASNRVKIYVNGIEQSLELRSGYPTTYPALNLDSHINNTYAQAMGAVVGGASNQFDGYLAEVNFIDGQALDPTDFGEFKSGVWIPKSYSGTYGTNGFYLDFGNSGSLGADSSGNGNNWTPNNLAATDQVIDSPTNNFATLNQINRNSTITLAEGNLSLTSTAAQGAGCGVTMATSSGKWYYETVYVSGVSTYIHVGLIDADATVDQLNTTNTAVNGTIYRGDGNIYENSGSGWSVTQTVTAASIGDIIGVAYDLDAQTCTYYLNNTQLGSAVSISYMNPEVMPYPLFGYYVATMALNFGQDSSFAGNKTAQGNTDANGIGDFYYAPPAGYLSLCTANLPDPAIDPAQDDVPADYFNTVLYTGNGSTQSITGVGFQPDFVWLKSRSVAANHGLHDVLRVISGNAEILYSNLTNAGNTGGGYLSSFDSDGFTVNNNTSGNGSGYTFAAWNWKAGGTGVSNTDGTITSTVSANEKAGFSIVSWESTSTITDTVGHGLSQAPEVVIWKDRDGITNWFYITNTVDGSWDYLNLNLTSSKTDYADASTTATTIKNFYTSSGRSVIAYCFHSVEGFSKFGSYTGNGSTDGPFVYTGFRPAFLLIKRASVAGNYWVLTDSARGTYNVMGPELYPNASDAEGTGQSLYDYTSNGFKMRNNFSAFNNSGDTYIYMAFAEMPFKYSNAR